MVSITEKFRLATLGHDIADIGDLGLGFTEGPPDFGNHEIGQDGGEKGAWAENNHITLHDSCNHFTAGSGLIIIIGIGHIDMVNHPLVACYLTLTSHFMSICKYCMKGQGIVTGWVNLSGCMEKFGQKLHGIVGGALHFRNACNQEITQRMAS